MTQLAEMAEMASGRDIAQLSDVVDILGRSAFGLDGSDC